MSRVTVFHVTNLRRLPLIEEEGLRTRADLSDRLGQPDGLDVGAPPKYAFGKRVSAYLSLEMAQQQTADLGPGLVSFTVDPSKAIGVPASVGHDDVAAYWAAAKPLTEWLSGDAPADLEVHQNVAVRAKHLQLHAPMVTDEDLGIYAPIVAACADADRLSAKALMHLAIVASEGDFASPEFLAAAALAWRDTEDEGDLVRELVETDPDKVASAALAEYGGDAPEGTAKLRAVLDEIRAWGDENGIPAGQAIFARTSAVLDGLAERPVITEA